VGQELRKLLIDAPSFKLVGGADLTQVYRSTETGPGEGSGTDRTLEKSVQRNSTSLLASVRDADLLIDFSLPEGTKTLIQELSKFKDLRCQGILVGTTGISKDEVQALAKILLDQGMRLLVTPNTSIGIGLMIQAATAIAQKALSEGFDASLLDIHHRYKKDKPSGTALLIRDQVLASLESSAAPEFEIAAQRTGGVLGEHHLTFGSDEEVIRISHMALSRALFAKGALYLGQWLLRQKPGIYGWKDVWGQ
jgi:4-hydroxy-tetrahydrodipicolinate reductase